MEIALSSGVVKGDVDAGGKKQSLKPRPVLVHHPGDKFQPCESGVTLFYSTSVLEISVATDVGINCRVHDCQKLCLSEISYLMFVFITWVC